MARTNPVRFSAAQRRFQVSELYLRGYTQTEVAQQLNVSQATVNRDIHTLLTNWQQSAGNNFETIYSTKLQELARLRKTAWESWELSRKPLPPCGACTGGAGESAGGVLQDQISIDQISKGPGDPRFLNLIARLSAQEQSLVALDLRKRKDDPPKEELVAPWEFEPSPPPRRAVTPEERRELADLILTKLGFEPLQSDELRRYGIDPGSPTDGGQQTADAPEGSPQESPSDDGRGAGGSGSGGPSSSGPGSGGPGAGGRQGDWPEEWNWSGDVPLVGNQSLLPPRWRVQVPPVKEPRRGSDYRARSDASWLSISDVFFWIVSRCVERARVWRTNVIHFWRVLSDVPRRLQQACEWDSPNDSGVNWLGWPRHFSGLLADGSGWLTGAIPGRLCGEVPDFQVFGDSTGSRARPPGFLDRAKSETERQTSPFGSAKSVMRLTGQPTAVV